MSDYLSMDKAALQTEQQQLQEVYAHFKERGLQLDMSRGKPSPDQLDLSLDMLKMDVYRDDTGVDGRNYGNLEGMPEARRYFAGMLGAQPSQTVVGGNSSLQMMYTVVDLGWRKGFTGHAPWSQSENPKFLCPSPGYDRHFRVAEVFGFELVIVPMTETGPDMDVMEALCEDESVKGVWCIPIYSNPDGYVYSEETVRRMASMTTAAPDFKILWDNAYGFHHLTDEHLTCPNILEECIKAGNPDRAVMFCSTSKITFAGAGVGAVAASESVIGQYIQFISAMTIGSDKINQLRHVRFLEAQGGLDAQMKKQAEKLRPKFTTVTERLHKELDPCGGIATWTEPKGGYFISLYTMKGCAKRVVALCKEAGVVLTGAGAAYPYGIDPDDHHIRIAPTFPPVAELEQAVDLLAIATRLASVEKLLA